jgi:type II secretory pathway component PulF
MAVFAYKATNPAAMLVRGTIVADTPRQARDELRGRGLTIHDVAPQEAATSGVAWKLLRRPGRSAAKVGSAVRELATLLGAGIALLESLDTLANQARGSFRSSLLMLRERVAAGSSLAEAMREQPDVYDTLCIQMVDVGENSGTLDVVLEQLSSFSERSLEFKDRVTSALMYPALVLFMSAGVGMFLMTVVVPMLLDNLLDAGRPLPWPTRVLKGLSDGVRHQGWWIAIVVVLVAVGIVAALRTERGRFFWHRLLLRLPLVGGMARKQEIARVAMIISTLMKSGIVFLQALETAARATKNRVISQALLSGRDAVLAGRDIGEALAPTGVFPAMVIQIFTVGQQSGKLEEMLDRLSATYERQVNSLATRLAAALEPILIVFLSIFVGFILFATILPILEAGNVL